MHITFKHLDWACGKGIRYTVTKTRMNCYGEAHFVQLPSNGEEWMSLWKFSKNIWMVICRQDYRWNFALAGSLI